DRGDLVVGRRPFLVKRDRLRDLVAVVVAVDVELLAADAAVLVDPGEGVDDALAVGRTDVGGAAREILEMADRDLRLCAHRSGCDDERERCRAQKRLQFHWSFLLLSLMDSPRLNVKTDRASSRS